MFGTVQDITDRKRAQEALQQNQFYLAEGSALPTWAAGRSTLPDSITGPPSYSRFTALIPWQAANNRRIFGSCTPGRSRVHETRHFEDAG